MTQLEVSLSDYVQTLIRFYISLIKYKIGNLIDPPLKRKRGELDDKWLERSSIAQAQRFVNYYRDMLVKSAVWAYRSDLESFGKKGKDLKKAIKVANTMALNKFDEYQRRIDQRVFEQKYKRAS